MKVASLIMDRSMLGGGMLIEGTIMVNCHRENVSYSSLAPSFVAYEKSACSDPDNVVVDN